MTPGVDLFIQHANGKLDLDEQMQDIQCRIAGEPYIFEVFIVIDPDSSLRLEQSSLYAIEEAVFFEVSSVF